MLHVSSAIAWGRGSTNPTPKTRISKPTSIESLVRIIMFSFYHAS
jgi:hypothetical protein